MNRDSKGSHIIIIIVCCRRPSARENQNNIISKGLLLEPQIMNMFFWNRRRHKGLWWSPFALTLFKTKVGLCRFTRTSAVAALPPRRFRHRAPPRFLGRTKAQYLDLLTRTNTRACAFVSFLVVPAMAIWSWKYVTITKPAKEAAKEKVSWYSP